MRPGSILSFGLGIAATVSALWLVTAGASGLSYVIVGLITAALLVVLAAVAVRMWMSVRFEEEGSGAPSDLVELLWRRRKEMALMLSLIFLLGVTAEIVLIVQAMATFIQAERMRAQNELLGRQEVLLVSNTEAEYVRAQADARIKLAPFDIVSEYWSGFGIIDYSDTVSEFLCKRESFQCDLSRLGDPIRATRNLDALDSEQDAYAEAIFFAAAKRGREAEAWDYTTPDETGWHPFYDATAGGGGQRFFRLAQTVCEVPAPIVEDGIEAARDISAIENWAVDLFVAKLTNSEMKIASASQGDYTYARQAIEALQGSVYENELDGDGSFRPPVIELSDEYYLMHQKYYRAYVTLLILNDFCQRRRAPLDEIVAHMENALSSIHPAEAIVVVPN